MSMKVSVAIAMDSKAAAMKYGAGEPGITAINCGTNVMESEVAMMGFGMEPIAAIRMAAPETVVVEEIALSGGASSHRRLDKAEQIIQAITGVKKKADAGRFVLPG